LTFDSDKFAKKYYIAAEFGFEDRTLDEIQVTIL